MTATFPDGLPGQPEVAAALDMLLTQAALGRTALLSGPLPVAAGDGPGQPAGTGGRRARELAAELARVADGTSGIAPAKKDRRFSDPAWTGNPALRRTLQAYLATGNMALGLVEDAAAGPRLDRRDTERLRFAVSNLVDALAPSNSPLLSPEAWKAAIDTGGSSVLAGARHLASDLSSAPRIPSMVPAGAFTVGTDLAVTPGAVVARTPVLELIQYQPQTETVAELPVLIIPPTINKYYVLDLAPGRSLIEYLVGQGQQVFVVSWRNPDARHAEWGFDEYVRAILEAVNATGLICGADSVHLLSACSGGILSALAAAVDQARRTADGGQHSPRLASLGILVTMLDQSRTDTLGSLVDETTAEAAIAASARKGYLDGRKLAEIFAWLRPGDLIWNYWVNNYLLGREPAAFDILFWNADTTRMTAGLHRDFVRASVDNALVRPGALTVLGTEVDLAQVRLDCYAVAGVADHICPWESCYRSAQLHGGKARFVLSTSGHIAALVNPPGSADKPNVKSRFQASDDVTAGATQWLADTATQQGSWWPDYAAWLAARSGGQVAAPGSLGSQRFRAIEPLPAAMSAQRERA